MIEGEPKPRFRNILWLGQTSFDLIDAGSGQGRNFQNHAFRCDQFKMATGQAVMRS